LTHIIHSPLANKRQGLTKGIKRLAQSVSKQLQRYPKVLIFGGDHSCAIGTWSGVRKAYPQARIGLLWLDAHLDSHSPLTSPSGNIHGMPVACLLGNKHSLFQHMIGYQAVIHPKDCIIIGVRSYEPQEARWLNSQGVEWHPLSSTPHPATSLDIALRKLCRQCDIVGISIDLDAFDPTFAPGVETPAANGVDPRPILPVIKRWLTHSKLRCVEIAEYTPVNDREDRTFCLIKRLIS
jgi:arginase